jgi:VanZ family protein
MTATTKERRLTKKSGLTVVWIAICGVFAGLLLHPAVPAVVRAAVSNPNWLAAEVIEYGAHIAVFFVATQMALVCLDGASPFRRRTILTLASAGGVAAEYAQRWVPGRGVDVFDAVCNVAGVALAAFVYNRVFQTPGLCRSASI